MNLRGFSSQNLQFDPSPSYNQTQKSKWHKKLTKKSYVTNIRGHRQYNNKYNLF